MPSRYASILNHVRTVVRGIRYTWPNTLTYWEVTADLDRVPYLPFCASCLAPANGSRREVRPGDGKSVIVPYCSLCLARIGRLSTGLLAWVLASILLGSAACLFLPLFPWISEGTAIGSAVAFGGLPWLVGQIWRNHAESHDSIRGKTVHAVAEGLICLNAEWARRLGDSIGAVVQPKRLRIGASSAWAFSGVVIALVATPLIYSTFHSTVRVLNLSEEGLIVFADNHQLARVQSTSHESPLAGQFVQVPTGTLHFEARRADGTTVEQVQAEVIPGRPHLFAPGRPASVCFWIERIGFGRTSAGHATWEVLAPRFSFWAIGGEIDVWFRPAVGSKSSHFTGGTVTALRQGPCDSTLRDLRE